MKSLQLKKTSARPTLTSCISSAHVGFWLNINLKLPQIGEEALSPSLFPFSLQFQHRGTNISASQKSINNLTFNFTSQMKFYHWLIISMFLSPWKAGDSSQDFVCLFFFFPLVIVQKFQFFFDPLCIIFLFPMENSAE